MDIKRTFATLALTTLLFTGSNYYYHNELNDSRNETEELKHEQGLKDSEIAKLKDSLKDKEDDINKLDSKLNDSLEINEELESEIKTLKDNNKKLKKENEDLRKKEKKEIHSVNFNESVKGSDDGSRKLNVQMTAYIAQCKEGCTGITATGVDIRGTTTHQGMRVIATDPNIIPLNSIVEIDVNGNRFKAISLDTGGAINGHIVDFLVSNESEAIEFGRQDATITILREGE